MTRVGVGRKCSYFEPESRKRERERERDQRGPTISFMGTLST
jgi:hypothetical protein